MNTWLALWMGLELATVLMVAEIVWSDWSWHRRRLFIFLPIVTSFVSLYAVLAHDRIYMTVPVALMHIYYVVNMVRVFHALSPEARLRQTLLREQSLLAVTTICLTTVWWMVAHLDVDSILGLFSVVSLAFAALMAVSLVLNVWHSRKVTVVKTPTANLPTVSLLIAARNEHHAIMRTIQAALASDYPKLEIIVLDDCSQDATDVIVKTFARQGVRFIAGDLPKTGWQARNQAFDRMLEEASGEYVAFMGVDVHVSPESIRSMIQLMISRKIDMVSVMPKRRHVNVWGSLLLVPRNFWLLAWPRGDDNPAVISSFWMMRRAALKQLGEFEAVRASINPERHFAKATAAVGRYRFITGDHAYGLTTRKRLSSQLETEIRNLYPNLHRSVARTALASMAYLAVFLVPFVGVWLPVDVYAKTAWALAIAVMVITHCVVYYFTIPKMWFAGVVNMPIVFAIEFWLMQVSMYRYEFSEVLWKGRNVCEPIKLRPIAHLPKRSLQSKTTQS